MNNKTITKSFDILIYINKVILGSFASIIITLLILSLSSCSTATPEEKVENAQENVKDAKQDLKAANQEFTEDELKYRRESEDKIAANEKSIAEFNTRIANEKAQAKADYLFKINALNKKNSDMKKRLDDYKAGSKENWEKFKTEFNHDMDELGKSFKNFTTKKNK